MGRSRSNFKTFRRVTEVHSSIRLTEQVLGSMAAEGVMLEEPSGCRRLVK